MFSIMTGILAGTGSDQHSSTSNCSSGNLSVSVIQPCPATLSLGATAVQYLLCIWQDLLPVRDSNIFVVIEY